MFLLSAVSVSVVSECAVRGLATFLGSLAPVTGSCISFQLSGTSSRLPLPPPPPALLSLRAQRTPQWASAVDRKYLQSINQSVNQSECVRACDAVSEHEQKDKID